MSADDTSDSEGSGDDAEGSNGDGFEAVGEGEENVRERLEQGADKAVESFDEGIVDLLSWVLETETRARIYVYLRQNPQSTSDEIADGTGLYPSTVREALAELHDEETVDRQKRESDGAGNNPYEYSAMAPSELVGNIVPDVQEELNTVFNLDQYIGDGDDDPIETDSDPVTITVEDDEADDADSADGETGDADSADGETGDADSADGETGDVDSADEDDEE